MTLLLLLLIVAMAVAVHGRWRLALLVHLPVVRRMLLLWLLWVHLL